MNVSPFSRRPLITAVALIVIAAACADAPTAPRTPGSAPHRSLTTLDGAVPTGRVAVVFSDSTAIPAAGLELLDQLGATITSRFDDFGVAFVTGLDLNGLLSLEQSPLVAAVGQDRILKWLPPLRVGGAVQGGLSLLSRRDPWNASYYLDGTQWSVRVIQADRVWRAGMQGAPTTRVAILDTGIDYDHREMTGRVDRDASASFTSLIVSAEGSSVTVPVEPQLPGDRPYMDNHFHGTHVASSVATNNISVAGVAPGVTLIAVKVLNFQGSGTFEGVISGIEHAAGPARAHVINMSLGANVDPNAEGVAALLTAMRRVIQWAERQGTIVISAAGNSSIDLDASPLISTPCQQSTICVSATGPLLQQNFDQPATYTNYGFSAIHVAAPGGNFDPNGDYVNQDLVIGACSRRTSEPQLAVCRVNTDGAVYFYAYAAGTSMASPHVAAQAALVRWQNPTLSVSGIKQRILTTADDVHTPGRDAYTNYGRINVARAMRVK